jgi:hypothetical protein
MRTELSVQRTLPFAEIMTMAQTFAESGMFTDAKAMGQAFVKIQAGQEIGIPPFAAMSGIHIIQGKPTIGAGLIASTVKGSGKYDYKVLEMTEKVCRIEFFQGSTSIGLSEFTIEDAKKALTKNIDKFPKNMLFARAISNGVKWYCPDVFAGPVYTPEEMDTIDITHTEVMPAAPVVSYEQDLREQGSMEDLLHYFTSMPKDKQVEFKELAGELKEQFLEDMSDEDLRGLLGDIVLGTKAEATAKLKETKKSYRFTADQEAEINKIVSGLTTKKAA